MEAVIMVVSLPRSAAIPLSWLCFVVHHATALQPAASHNAAWTWTAGAKLPGPVTVRFV